MLLVEAVDLVHEQNRRHALRLSVLGGLGGNVPNVLDTGCAARECAERTGCVVGNDGSNRRFSTSRRSKENNRGRRVSLEQRPHCRLFSQDIDVALYQRTARRDTMISSNSVGRIRSARGMRSMRRARLLGDSVVSDFFSCFTGVDWVKEESDPRMGEGESNGRSPCIDSTVPEVDCFFSFPAKHLSM